MQEEQITPKAKISKHHSSEHKQRHLNAWQASGLSMSEYCRQNNLSISNLSNWNARSKSKRTIKSNKLQSIKCMPKSSCSQPSPVEIVLPDGIKIRLATLNQLAVTLKIITG